MAQIKYPPYIEGTLPAFYDSDDEEKIIITVPFMSNPAIGSDDYQGFTLKLRYAYNDSEISLNKNEINSITSKEEAEETHQITFMITKPDVLTLGQFYKIQIAYSDGSYDEGVYSTTGVAKYSKKGIAKIVGFDASNINLNKKIFRGEYTPHKKDTYEKEYKYQFFLYNNINELLYTSGEQLHNNNLAYDEWYFNRILQKNTNYFLQYQVTTLNGLIVYSEMYNIIEAELPSSEYLFNIDTELNSENAYVNIKLTAFKKDKNGNIINNPTVSGYFSITRSSKADNYEVWNEIGKVKFTNENIFNKIVFKDFLIEHGQSYKYAIQQYNIKDLYSERMETINPIHIDFEHIFLYDGNRQLKIKYNPKVSTFKDNVLESKTDTIGGPFPYIFRNKSIKYKEFALSGLLSYLSDEENLFTKSITKGYYDDKDKFINIETTNLTCNIYNEDQLIFDNIYNEREYKLQVLSWLNNGEMKILKSPVEGNYIVRLMNVSLSPLDTVGRMLHTFTASAYEMAEYNINNLNNYKFIDIENIKIDYQWNENWTSVNLNEVGKIINFEDQNLLQKVSSTTHLQITGAKPGTQFSITLSSMTPMIITIGMTGHYEIHLEKDIISVKMLTRADNEYTGVLTYNYLSKSLDVFNKISSYNLQDVIAISLYGDGYIDLTQQSVTIGKEKISLWRDLIKNLKTKSFQWKFLQFRKRPIIEIPNKLIILNNLYENFGQSSFFGGYQDSNLYICDNVYYIKLYCLTVEKEIMELYKPIEALNYKVYIGNNEIDLNNRLDETLQIISPMDLNTNKDNEIEIGNGVIADVGYRVLNIDYTLEEDFPYFNALKEMETDISFKGWMIYQKYYHQLLRYLTEEGIEYD